MNEVEVLIDLTSYQVEVLRLIAERRGLTIQDFINSIFFVPQVHCTK